MKKRYQELWNKRKEFVRMTWGSLLLGSILLWTCIIIGIIGLCRIL